MSPTNESTLANPRQMIAELQRQLIEARAERDEAFAQQTAAAEVLRVINSSAGDLAPVFQAMLDKAIELCGAAIGGLGTWQGDRFSFVAARGISPEFAGFIAENEISPGPRSGFLRVARGPGYVQFNDLSTSPFYAAGDPLTRAVVDIDGGRTTLNVPLVKDDNVIGIVAFIRREVRPFSERQIAVLRSFAAQAVLAIENARLLEELRRRTRDLEESLEYQTATGDVLQAISRSTFDLQPVLDTVCETAARLCAAHGAGITMREGDGYRYVSTYSLEPEFYAYLRARILPADRGTIAGRTALEGKVVHIPDIAADPEYAVSQTTALGKLRTLLGAPLMRDGAVIGTLTLTRNHVEPFSDRQIELVRTFADQAVIAIENARLLTEQRESLEQQQAMAEVLGVINANPGHLQPVFDAMLAKAMQLCDAAFGGLVLWRDEGWRMATQSANVSPPFAEFLAAGNMSPGPRAGLARVARNEGYIHFEDIAASKFYRAGDPTLRAMADLGGGRTALTVPLTKDDEVLGFFSFYRQEVKIFSERQIALVRSFAAQAVIAMDNARLLDEIRQRSAELHVTFDNMGDGVAMFDPDLRLAAWNRNFQRLLDLPDDFLATRPRMAEYFHYLAERGEYDADLEAELSRRIEDATDVLRFERARPDGRVVEVRRNPVPGGGCVLMYGDVTERKRAEAEIHAARDAAEEALAELRATQQQLVVQQKMAALGQLTAGIAHEIKNPLNFVNNFAGLSNELLEELKEAAAPAMATLDPGTRAEIDDTLSTLAGNLGKIAEHGRRADGIVKSMLEHSRGGTGDRRDADLNALVEDALNLAYHGARARDQNFNITLERDLDPAVAPIELAPQEMTRVFLNLFGNGFYAAAKQAQTVGDGFRPVLKVSTRDLGNAVEVLIRDNGTGIAPAIRDKLFQPFVTTKPTGEGTGLGLSISYDIVTQQHSGTISVESEPGQFTQFTVRLPRR